MNKKNVYDVIVIGAGNGGLTAATNMLLHGKKTLVLEKHNIPGGFATSFVRGRFEFEASLHEFNGMGSKLNPGSSYKLFETLGIIDKLEFKHLEHSYHLYTEKEHIDFLMPIGRENILKASEKISTNGRKEMELYLSISENIVSAMKYINACKGEIDINVMKEKYLPYLRYSSLSVNEAFDKLGFSKEFIDIISAYWSYIGTPLNEMNFGHYANMTYKYFIDGATIPVLRSHGMSLALENRIHELGGEIYFNSEVEKILTNEKGEITGVRLISGEVYYGKHIIANVSPHVVYGRLLDKSSVPVSALKLTNFRKLSARGFSLFLGLNKSPKELGLNDHCYFIYKTADSISTYEEMKKLPHDAGQATVCLNNVDPSCSPKGTTILYFTTLFTSDCWANVSEEEYTKTKNLEAKMLIDQFERVTGIKIKPYIEELAVATPVTYARYTTHPQGVIYGYESQYDDSLMARIMMSDEDVKIKGLRICGGYGERLDGFSSSYKSGFNESNRMLKDMEKEK